MTHGKLSLRDPIVVAIALAFILECSLNAAGAYDFLGGGDGGIKAKGIAFGGALVAFLGAWSGHEGAAKGMRDGWGFWPWLMMTVAVVVFLLSQFAGWRVLGVSFSDGALKREVAGESLESQREERRRIGVTRPVKAIESDLDLEKRRTSRSYPDGKGPAATKLEGELATALRAIELERSIARAQQGGAAVKAGAENAIAEKVLGMDKETAQLVLVVTLCALIGFFANFGLALLHVVRGPPDGGGGGVRRTGLHEAGLRREPGETWHAFGQRVGDATHRMLDMDMPQLLLPAAAGPATAGGAQHHQQGVTINIAPSGGAVNAQPAAREPHAPAAGGGAGERRTGPQQRRPRHDLPALPADAPPIDRSRIVRELSAAERPAADVILAFRAACVIDAPGGLVSADNLYRRYRHWAGDRALEMAPFVALFGDVTGVRIADVSGFAHAHDVALRVGAALRVA